MQFVKHVLLLLSPMLPAFAQEFPSRPITLVRPFSAGRPGDVMARLLGSSMSATLKQPMLIENVVGAGGTIGTNRVAKAALDGYTLLQMHVGKATAPALLARAHGSDAVLAMTGFSLISRSMRRAYAKV